MPELPREMRRAGARGGEIVDIDGVACEHWVEEIAGFERTHVCVSQRASSSFCSRARALTRPPFARYQVR